MSLLTIIQLLVFFLPTEYGIEILLSLAVSLLTSLQFFFQFHFLMFHPTVNLQMLALVGTKLVQTHIFHVLKLLLELHKRDAAEDGMILVVKLLDGQSKSDHFLVWFLLAHLINQSLLFYLELFEEMLDVELFL